MNSRPFFPRALLLGALCLLAASARAQVESVLTVRTFAYGQYDFSGRSWRGNETLNDLVIGQRNDGNAPYRAYLAFHLPRFTGTLVHAEIVFSYSELHSWDGLERLRWSEVSTPVHEVRAGGLTRTDIYHDLGDGPVFAEDEPCCPGFEQSLGSNALAAITAARGGDFALGGSVVSLSDATPYEYFLIPNPTDGYASLRLTVNGPGQPVIHTPVSVDYAGSNFFLGTVGASGATPLRYDWFVNGTNVATLSMEHVNPVTANLGFALAGSTQSVSVVVSNAFGVTSTPVTNLLTPPAVVGLAFTNYHLRAGEWLDLYGGVISLAVPNYFYQVQWLKNGQPLPGENYEWLSFFSTTTNDTGNYSLVVSNAAGVVTSAVVRVAVVQTPPYFTYHPQSFTGYAGDYGSLYYSVQNAAPYSGRWYHDGVLLPGTNTSLSFTPLTPADAGDYYVVVSNNVGWVTSQVAHVTVLTEPPAFTVQPSNSTFYAGAYASLYTASTGHPYPAYRWYKGGTLIATQSSSTLALGLASPIHNGSYYCVASNAYGTATSQVATITVLSVPPVVGGPMDTNVLVGRTFYWTVSLSNPPAFLQLVYEGTNVVRSGYYGGVPAPWDFGNVQLAQSGHYSVRGSNQFGWSTGRVATLSVTTAPPSLLLSVSESTVVEGSQVFFTADWSGAPAPTVTLRRGTNPVPLYYHNPAGFQTRWQIFAATLADEGDYTAVASNAVGTAVARVHLTVRRAGPLDKWTVRNPLPQGRDLNGVVWGGDLFVAVGDSGAIITSPNGTNWTVRNGLTAIDLKAVACGNGRFVAVGEDAGLSLVSTNGESWQSGSAGTNVYFNDITFGDGTFLAVGLLGPSFTTAAAFRSTNGLDWTQVVVPVLGPYVSLEAVSFGAGRFVALDYYGLAHASTDLVNWTNTPATIISYAAGLGFGNGNFVALGYGGLVNSSPDGMNWGVSTYNGVEDRKLNGVSYGAGRYVIVAGKGRVITSPGGLGAWTRSVTPTTDRLDDVVFGHGLFVAVGENGTVLTSADGLAWTNHTRGVNYDLDGLEVANGLAVAVGKGGVILTSTDGAGWSSRFLPGAPGLHGVGFGAGKWVAVGETTNVFVSTNAFDWQPYSLGLTSNYLKSVHYASNLWVAVGVGGLIVTSPDAMNWTVRLGAVAKDFNEVTYGDGVWVIVGDWDLTPNASILSSVDGVTWQDRSYSSGKNARGITHADGKFLITLNDGITMLATNLQPWTTPPGYYNPWEFLSTPVFGEGRNLRGSTWASNLWVVVGNNGIILTSTNARDWRVRLSPNYENLHAVRLLNDSFLAIGNEGIILQSGSITPRLTTERRGDTLRLVFHSPHDGPLRLQRTSNFNWIDAGWFTNTVGVMEFDVPLPPGASNEFFRVLGP